MELAGVRADASTRVAAVVAFYGNSDLLAEERERGGFTTNLGQLFPGHSRLDDATTALLKSASAVYQVRPGLPPFLLLHGNADRSVPYQRSVDLRASLQAAGVPCELITIPGGVHGMINWDQVAPDYRERFVAWLERALKSD